MTPARPRWRVLWCLAPLLPGLSFRDQPQLREDAVLAADEQAGARGRAAFGRHGDSPARTGARTKAVVPSPGRTRSDLGAFERPICPAQRLGLVEAGVPVGRYPWEPRL